MNVIGIGVNARINRALKRKKKLEENKEPLGGFSIDWSRYNGIKIAVDSNEKWAIYSRIALFRVQIPKDNHFIRNLFPCHLEVSCISHWYQHKIAEITVSNCHTKTSCAANYSIQLSDCIQRIIMRTGWQYRTYFSVPTVAIKHEIHPLQSLSKLSSRPAKRTMPSGRTRAMVSKWT